MGTRNGAFVRIFESRGKLLEDPVTYSTSFNFGPNIEANRTVWEVVEKLVNYYGKGKVVDKSEPNAVHENTLLSLDVTKAYRMLDKWHARLSFDESIEFTVYWYKEALKGQNMRAYCVKQINAHGAKK